MIQTMGSKIFLNWYYKDINIIRYPFEIDRLLGTSMF